MVFSTAARITASDAHAQDIAQEVFLRAYENFAQLRHSPTVGGWLRTVATRLSLNHLSRYRRRWRFFSELSYVGDDGSESEVEFAGPDTLLGDVDFRNYSGMIEEALQKLPGHQRVPLVLYHFEEMQYEEIAARLGISLAKVKTDIFRGRAALAKTLTRRGIDGAAELTPS